MIIFGGEDQNSNEINDLWRLSEVLGKEFLQVTKFFISLKGSKGKCTKLYKQTISRRPKLGTPCVRFNGLLFYIGKSSSEVIAPIRSYLCIEEFYEGNLKVQFSSSSQFQEPKNQTQTYSSKKHLPFDGVPHTFEIIKDKLILGYESSLYTIQIRKILNFFGENVDPL